MNKAKHTPGPWGCFYKHKYDEWHVSVPTAQGHMRLALFDDGVHSDNPEGDARLIAAAPDLLEALKALAPILDNDSPLVAAYAGIEPLVHAAIAKAEGTA